MVDFSTRKGIMKEWDAWVRYYRSGGGGTWPADAFESLLDYFDEQRQLQVVDLSDRRLMDDKLWELIKQYGSWSFLTGQYFQKEVHGKDYDRYTKKQDDTLVEIKRHLTSHSSEVADSSSGLPKPDPDCECPYCKLLSGDNPPPV